MLTILGIMIIMAMIGVSLLAVIDLWLESRGYPGD